MQINQFDAHCTSKYTVHGVLLIEMRKNIFFLLLLSFLPISVHFFSFHYEELISFFFLARFDLPLFYYRRKNPQQMELLLVVTQNHCIHYTPNSQSLKLSRYLKKKIWKETIFKQRKHCAKCIRI